MSADSRRALIAMTVLLMAPAILLLLFGLPQIVIAFVGLAADGTLAQSTMSREAIVGCLKIVGGALALLELGRLSLRTIQGHVYRFGIRFFVAAGLGLVATHYNYLLLGPEAALFVTLPLLFLAYRMWRVQRSIAVGATPGMPPP